MSAPSIIGGKIVENEPIQESENLTLLLNVIIIFKTDANDIVAGSEEDDVCKAKEYNNNIGNGLTGKEVFISSNSESNQGIKEEKIQFVVTEFNKNYKVEIRNIINKIEAKILNYEKIRIRILVPSFTKESIYVPYFLTDLLNDKFFDNPKIDLQSSTIARTTNYQLGNDDVKSSNNKNEDVWMPSEIDAKIAAIMSHYVYFYLDWLEVGYYYKNINDGMEFAEWEQTQDSSHKILFPIKDKNGSNSSKIENKSKKKYYNTGMSSSNGNDAKKIQLRVINRLQEIAKVVNAYNKDDVSWDELDQLLENLEYITQDRNDEELYNKLISGLDNIKNKLSIYKIRLDNTTIASETNNEEINNRISNLKENIEGIKKLEDKIYTYHDLRLGNNKDIILLRSIVDYNIYDIDKLRDEILRDIDNLDFGNLYRLQNSKYENVIRKILDKCKEDKKPMDFYDVYAEFGYWDYLDNEELKNEAFKWHVSHPDILREEQRKIFQKKELFIYKEKGRYPKDDKIMQYEYYNSFLKHGMGKWDGYGGALFVKTEIEDGTPYPICFAYVTKGTDANSINDWLFADILQGLTGFSLQHIHTVFNARFIDRAVSSYSKKHSKIKNIKIKGNEKKIEIPLFYAGHSLGGGLASSNAVVSHNRHAITFNSAGLNFIGSCATRLFSFLTLNISAFSPLGAARRVHPIRIKGEAIDELMRLCHILTLGLNERGYGSEPLIFDLHDGLSSVEDMGAKHGINNFLYKSLLSQIKIESKTKTVHVSTSDLNINSTLTIKGIRVKELGRTDLKFYWEDGENFLIARRALNNLKKIFSKEIH